MVSSFEPPAEIANIVNRLENLTNTAEHLIEDYYARTATGFLAFHLLQGADEATLRRIEHQAVTEYNRWFSHGDGITHDGSVAWAPGDEPAAVVYATSRPGHRYPLRNGQTFKSVLDEIRDDAGCDLQMFGDYCADSPGAVLVPIARGDLIIVARFCVLCWKQFVKDNRIRLRKCAVQTGFSDGLGSVGWLDSKETHWPEKPLIRTRKEYIEFLREHPHAGLPPKTKSS